MIDVFLCAYIKTRMLDAWSFGIGEPLDAECEGRALWLKCSHVLDGKTPGQIKTYARTAAKNAARLMARTQKRRDRLEEKNQEKLIRTEAVVIDFDERVLVVSGHAIPLSDIAISGSGFGWDALTMLAKASTEIAAWLQDKGLGGEIDKSTAGRELARKRWATLTPEQRAEAMAQVRQSRRK